MTTDRPEDLLLSGTLTTFRRRCGKPTCRCNSGHPHESPALRYTEGGRSKLVTLTEADIVEVTAALDRYQQARSAVEQATADGLARLRSRLAARRGASRP